MTLKGKAPTRQARQDVLRADAKAIKRGLARAKLKQVEYDRRWYDGSEDDHGYPEQEGAGQLPPPR
jgi:hypothetical protein